MTSSSPRLTEERILIHSLPSSFPSSPKTPLATNPDQEIKIRDVQTDDNFSNSKMIKSPKISFFSSPRSHLSSSSPKPCVVSPPPPGENEHVSNETHPNADDDEIFEDEVVIISRPLPRFQASPRPPQPKPQTMSSPIVVNTTEGVVEDFVPTAATTTTTPQRQISPKFFVSSSSVSALPSSSPPQRLPPPPPATKAVHSFIKRKASDREPKRWKHEMATDANGTNKKPEEAIPEGSGQGTILAYARRSAEDRSGRPLHSQFETIIGYVNECILPKLSPRSKESKIRKFFVDNGVSGTVEPEKRPGFCGLMEEIKALSSDGRMRSSIHVVAYDATRIARSLAVGSQIKKFLERAGATLHLAQSRMIVEGANAELFFGLNLQIASSERTLTITRVKNAFSHHPDWDPRKSFGWKFMGPGIPPEKIPEEQAILEKMRKMFEEEGLQIKEIAKIIQEETGGRRLRRLPNSPEEAAALEEKREKWTGTEVTFLAKKHKWKWGGGLTVKDLEKDVEIAKREGKDIEAFLREKKGTLYDGIKINRAMLKKYFIEAQPRWKAIAIERVRVWIRQEKHSVDDIANMLKDEVSRPGKEGWPRQTVWRLIKHCEELEKRSKATTIPT